MSGGCALNCPANSMLHRIGRFSEIFVPPSVDDSGLALGAAFLTTHDLFDIPRIKHGRIHQRALSWTRLV